MLTATSCPLCTGSATGSLSISAPGGTTAARVPPNVTGLTERAGHRPRRAVLTRGADGSASWAQVPVMCSGRTGTWFSASPVAARIAATMAGPEEIVGGSPTPRTP